MTFFCFQGEKNDSHDFVYDAIKGGASALVVERKIDIDFPKLFLPAAENDERNS